MLTIDNIDRDQQRKKVSQKRVVQYTRTESGRLFGKDDPSSGSRLVVFAEVKKVKLVETVRATKNVDES